MKTICTKCKGGNIYLVDEEIAKEVETQTLDEMANNLSKPVNLIWKPRTWACKDCGYSITEGAITMDLDKTTEITVH